MRSYIFALLFAFTLLVTVHAAALNKRVVSTAAQTCINSIKSVGEQLDATKPDIDAFSNTDGYSGAYAIHTKEQVIETRLAQASKDCCSLDAIAAEDVAGVLGVVTGLVPKVVDVLGSIVAKKLVFKDLALAITLLKNDVKAVATLTDSLATCLISKGSIADRVVGSALKVQLDTAFAAVAAL